jgi:hypothetical protein
MALYLKMFLFWVLVKAIARAVNGREKVETQMLLCLVAAIGIKKVVLLFGQILHGQNAKLQSVGLLAQTMKLALARQKEALLAVQALRLQLLAVRVLQSQLPAVQALRLQLPAVRALQLRPAVRVCVNMLIVFLLALKSAMKVR